VKPFGSLGPAATVIVISSEQQCRCHGRFPGCAPPF
jgi:hypothetical protein